MSDYNDDNLRNAICDYLIDELGVDEDEVMEYDDDELVDEIRDFISWLCTEVSRKSRKAKRLEARLLQMNCPDRGMSRDYEYEYEDLDCEADE